MRKTFVPLDYPGGRTYTPKFLGEFSSSQMIQLCCQHTATLGAFFSCQDINKKLSACWGYGAQGSQKLALSTHHLWGRCAYPVTCSSDKIRLNFATAHTFLLTFVCVNTSTSKNLSKKPGCLLKITVRSHEADRTEKGSLAPCELSYSNSNKLTDPSQGFLVCGPSRDETLSFLMKMQTFWCRLCPKRWQDNFKIQQFCCVTLEDSTYFVKIVLGLQLQNCNQHLVLWFSIRVFHKAQRQQRCDKKQHAYLIQSGLQNYALAGRQIEEHI